MNTQEIEPQATLQERIEAAKARASSARNPHDFEGAMTELVALLNEQNSRD